jgi:hypothetical protein
MAQSKAATVAEYLAELPGEQRAEVSAVRDVILANLPDGYAEGCLRGCLRPGYREHGLRYRI